MWGQKIARRLEPWDNDGVNQREPACPGSGQEQLPQLLLGPANPWHAGMHTGCLLPALPRLWGRLDIWTLYQFPGFSILTADFQNLKQKLSRLNNTPQQAGFPPGEIRLCVLRVWEHPRWGLGDERMLGRNSPGQEPGLLLPPGLGFWFLCFRTETKSWKTGIRRGTRRQNEAPDMQACPWRGSPPCPWDSLLDASGVSWSVGENIQIDLQLSGKPFQFTQLQMLLNALEAFIRAPLCAGGECSTQAGRRWSPPFSWGSKCCGQTIWQGWR